MSTRLAVLWHLHQPDYRDPTSGRPVMPWARLHALRGYRDLLVELVEGDVPMTVNLVPSLWDQLLYYAEGGDDRHLELTRKPASELSEKEAAEVVASLPGGHHAMTEALPAYARLRRRLSAGPPYRVPELRDLQVWATLAWAGATARRDYPELEALAQRPGGFSEADKEVLLCCHDAVLRDLPRRLQALVDAPGPALATSPYFHPILPLLVDVRHALRALPELPLDVRFAWPEDALRQLTEARERVEALTGRAPDGLWPSEGSVSPEVVALAGEAGFRWLVSDRGVLRRSDVVPRSGGRGAWELGHGVVGFFRDTDLSDRIGFRYALRDPREAVADFVAGVQKAGPGVVTVALDGENPWESYPDAGGRFRRALYAAVTGRRAQVRAITLDAAARFPAVGQVRQLHTGSWIGADFRIWIGHPDDRAAWRVLAEAREAAEAAAPAQREAAMPHLLAAEGSDWTWWYGDDFHTDWQGSFDALFRAHLRAAWEALGQTPPASLDRPVGALGAPRHDEPTGFLPLTWASAGAWLPWQSAGTLRGWGGSMAAGSAVLAVRYGWSIEGDLWLRAEVRGEDWAIRRPTPAEAPSESRLVDGHLVVRIPAAEEVAIQLVGPEGQAWPPEPAPLSPPAEPVLAWWMV